MTLNMQQPGAGAPPTIREVSTVLERGLEIVADGALPLLMALAAIGIVSMAVQQVIKDILRLHVVFNRDQLDAWLESRGAADPVLNTLVLLATGGDKAALYELPAARMTGQIAMASRVALAFPAAYEDVLRTLAGPDAKNDIDEIVKGTKPSLEEERMRVAHLIERNLDALQITLTSRWERANKRYAFVVSLLVTVIAMGAYFYVNLAILDLSVPDVLRLSVITAAAGILAGFVAPIAKDLVAALQKLRR